MIPHSKFIFQKYNADTAQGVAEFHYQIKLPHSTISFTEKIFFLPVSQAIPQDLLASLLQSLLLILGISYWKLYCPKDIEIASFSLSKEQAVFWNAVYTKGLGEFFYKNQIDYRGLVAFPFGEEQKVSRPAFVQPSSRLLQTNKTTAGKQDRSLLLVGGGKDSLVSAELLKKTKRPFTAFVVNPRSIHEETISVMGAEQITLKRELDPKLFALNKEKGVYNGHVPATAMVNFLSLFAAVLYDYRSIIASNEKSANYGNVEYLGEEINHQWSKSEEFERLFQSYVGKFITPDIQYFSLLRPMTELKITEIFTQYEQYFPVFSSCNRNFRVSSSDEKTSPLSSPKRRGDKARWCGECPKCLFVFIMLAAFLSKEKVLGIFGKNLFTNEQLIPLFRELLGVGEIKPFECVGTPEEVRYAMYLVNKKGEFGETPMVQIFEKEAMLSDDEAEKLREGLFSVNTNKLPEEFREVL